MTKQNFILTFSGRNVDLLQPDPADIRITDIAHALSQISRFNGHTRAYYSVAQHSVLVSHLVPKRFQLRALLHDAAEAYFGDMVRPLKYLDACAEYRRHEQNMQLVINACFHLEPETELERDLLRQADLIMLATERRDLMAPDSTVWPILEGIEPRPSIIRPLMPNAAEADFIGRFKQLTGVQ